MQACCMGSYPERQARWGIYSMNFNHMELQSRLQAPASSFAIAANGLLLFSPKFPNCCIHGAVVFIQFGVEARNLRGHDSAGD